MLILNYFRFGVGNSRRRVIDEAIFLLADDGERVLPAALFSLLADVASVERILRAEYLIVIRLLASIKVAFIVEAFDPGLKRYRTSS